MPKLTHARPGKPNRRPGAVPRVVALADRTAIEQRAARFAAIYDLEAARRGLAPASPP